MTIPRASETPEQTGTLTRGWGEIRETQEIPPPWKTVSQFLTKLSIVSSYDSAIALQDIHQIELQTYLHTTEWK